MSRTPLTHEPPLLGAERALRLAEDARAFLREPAEWAEDDDASLAITAAHDATFLALEVAIDTGDPHLLAATLEVAEEAARGRDDPWEFSFASAAKELLPHVGEITNRVRECARSKSNVLRYYTARALGPRALRSMRGEGDDTDAEAAQIVFALARDEDGWVRESAREALGGAAPPAWAPFFPRDPLASLSAAEAARLRGPLDRAAELLDKVDGLDVSALAAAMTELSDELALPLLEAFVRIPSVIRAKGADGLLERWTRCDADGARLLAWLERPPREGYGDGKRLGAALARRSSVDAASIGLRIARFIMSLDDERHTDRLSLAEDILRESWPADADPTPLLELLVGAPLADAGEADPEPPPVHDLGIPPLVGLAVTRGFAVEPAREALIHAVLASFPGRWNRWRVAVAHFALEVRDPRLRAHAETLFRSGSTPTEIGWALRYLVNGGHDPARDPEPAEILRAASLDPRLRAAMIEESHLRVDAREPLRAQLAAGLLPPHEAIQLAFWIVLGGRRDALRPDEWPALRRARAEATDARDRADAALVLPLSVGDWTDDDHAFIERLVDELGHDEHVADRVSCSLEARPALEHVPLLERLLTHQQSEELREEIEEAIKVCRGGKRTW